MTWLLIVATGVVALSVLAAVIIWLNAGGGGDGG